MAHKAHFPGLLSLEPTGELERKPALATASRRRKKKDLPTGAEPIEDPGLPSLIADEWTTMVNERATRGIFEESPIVGRRIDERLPFGLPGKTVFELRREL